MYARDSYCELRAPNDKNSRFVQMRNTVIRRPKSMNSQKKKSMKYWEPKNRKIEAIEMPPKKMEWDQITASIRLY